MCNVDGISSNVSKLQCKMPATNYPNELSLHNKEFPRLKHQGNYCPLLRLVHEGHNQNLASSLGRNHLICRARHPSMAQSTLDIALAEALFAGKGKKHQGAQTLHVHSRGNMVADARLFGASCVDARIGSGKRLVCGYLIASIADKRPGKRDILNALGADGSVKVSVHNRYYNCPLRADLPEAVACCLVDQIPMTQIASQAPL